MKVTAKANTSEKDIEKAVRIAQRVKSLPADSPVLAGLNRQYDDLVDRIGYDPIS
ncbi:hypothetical protein [Micromonospora sp. Mcm103]|uniref:hypothetical protein n=1 Tax=Micromonospora sp. Mcm103 TaxID=2926015 RepID=UPI0021C77DCE|nr:hypothetical protein [Micromonospora sp. Mcm103]